MAKEVGKMISGNIKSTPENISKYELWKAVKLSLLRGTSLARAILLKVCTKGLIGFI